MTVSTAYSPLTYSGNGATTAFAVTWPFFTGTLVVTAIDADGLESVKTITTHYTVSGGTGVTGLPASGTVTMLTAPASGTTLRISRVTPKTQATTWGENDNFPQKTIEAALDKNLLIAQELLATAADEITGDFLQLDSSGATDFWDGESHKLRNLTAGTEVSDAVNVAQLNAAAFGSLTSVSLTAHLDLAENATPGTPAANVGRLHALDESGLTRIGYLDASGTTRALAHSVTTTRGDVIRRGASGDERLALGTSGFHLQSDGTDAAWSGFTQAGTGATTRTWQNKSREWVTAEDFGAVGDGVTDDAAAINAALTAVGYNGCVRLLNKTYAIGSEIIIKQAQLLIGTAPSGDVFGAVRTSGGSNLQYIGSAGGVAVSFGADRTGGVGTLQTFGGGIVNVGIYGGSLAGIVLRLAACANATFHNLKISSLRTTGTATLWCGANTTVSGLENTIRHCSFQDITLFAYGATTALYNASNNPGNPGSEGGLTFCQFRNINCQFGYDNGAGHGFYFSSMDDCDFYGISANRASGTPTGHNIYLDGNAAFGKQTFGNTFNMIHVSRSGAGGGTIFADGQYVNEVSMTGINGVDEAPVITTTNGAMLNYSYLGTGYGVTPGFVVQQPTRMEGRYASIDTTQTVATIRRASSGTPAAPIGAGLAYEVETAADNYEIGGRLDIVTFDVTPASEDFFWSFNTMEAGVLNETLRIYPTALFPIASVNIGSGPFPFQHLFLASTKTINFANGDWVATHSTGILTVGTGDLRVTTAGTNAASVVTVGGTQTLTNKTLTSARVTTDLRPTANDGASLGVSGTAFADIFLATGAVINYAAGGITLTHSADRLELSRSTNLIYKVSVPASGASDYAALQLATGAGNAFQIQAKNNTIIVGQESVGDFLTLTSAGAISLTGAFTAYSGTGIPAGGTTGAGLKLSSTANFGVFFGSGAPTLSAAQGSLYLRSDGSSTSTRLYVNTNGTTGWTNFTSAT